MRAERFHSKCFGGVVAAEKKVDSQFLRRDRGPVRRLAGDESVDPFAGDVVNLGAGAARNEADRFRLSRTGGKQFYRTA